MMTKNSEQNNKTCYIVSLKYAPGLWKEFTLLGENLRKHGFAVKYLLSKRYKNLKEDHSDMIFVSDSQNVKAMLIDVLKYPIGSRRICAKAFREVPPVLVCCYNPHPLNFTVFKLAKQFAPKCIRLAHLHEPARPGKSRYGWKGRMFFEIVEYAQKLTLVNSTDVILHSPFALELFEQKYKNYSGRKHYSPLLIPDNRCKTKTNRRFFSMIGRFNFAKKPDMFIETINLAAQKGEDLEFQIVTASCIDNYLKKLTPEGRSKLHLIIKKNLSDEDISTAVSDSFAVISLQPLISQSGMMVVSFMNAAPIIARSIPGFAQFVKHQANGYLLEDNFSCQDLINAMKAVRKNFDAMSENARQSYLELFAEKNWDSYYSWLPEQLSKDSL
ncbi:MAG TPA: glycosyltransferase [Sedimentisphaerales bacterium]|nr:glycosyltransferase [Sedimentisphaerales bacterium]